MIRNIYYTRAKIICIGGERLFSTIKELARLDVAIDGRGTIAKERDDILREELEEIVEDKNEERPPFRSEGVEGLFYIPLRPHTDASPYKYFIMKELPPPPESE